MSAQPAYSDDRPATTEPREECHRLRSTARKNDPGVAVATGHGSTLVREGRNRTPPRRGKTNMFDGSRPLWGNSRILKRRVGVGMFQRRSHQPPEPGTITPPEVQAKIHNYVFAHRVQTPASLPGQLRLDDRRLSRQRGKGRF